jgi:branched-chain amino acid transport system permease protein
MVSAGLTLIFGMIGVLNFAHAWFYMLGAYVGFTLTRHGGFWVGLVHAPFVAGLTGVLVERYMLRRVHKYGHAHELLLTFGLAFIIEEVIKLFYGDALVSYQMPDYMRFAAFTIFDTNIILPAVHGRRGACHVRRALYPAHTHRVGIVVRAATYRPTTVRLSATTCLVHMAVFAGGSALAGLAGPCGAADRPQHGRRLWNARFRRRVIGGLGSSSAPLRFADDRAVHLLLGGPQRVDRRLARPVRARAVGSDLAGHTLQLSTIANSMPFMLMLLVLLIRPAGLMGDRQ